MKIVCYFLPSKQCFLLDVAVAIRCRRTYFTRRGIHIRALDKKDVLGTGFNPDLDTKVLIHGFNNGVTSDSMQDTKNGEHPGPASSARGL
jgi:hypothetical protein